MNSSPDKANPTALDPVPAPHGHPPASPSLLPSPLASGLASGSGGPRALPGRTRGRRIWPWVLLTLVAGVAGMVTLRILNAQGLVPAQYDLTSRVVPLEDKKQGEILYHTVKREPSLDVKVTEKGTLESVDNREIICKVRAGAKGFATSINWVIDDGSKVHANQLLMVLDDSALQDQYRDQKIKVDNALAAKIQAEKQYDIIVKDNQKKVAEAENALILARIELEKFFGLQYDPTQAGLAAVAGVPATLVEGGDYKRQFDDLTGQVRLAESDVEQNRERSAWADRMVKMKYMSPAQAQAERSRLESSLEKLRSLEAQKTLLIAHDRRKNLTDLKSKIINAQRTYEKEKLSAEATEIQADVDRKNKASVYDQEDDKLDDIKSQISECQIRAPADLPTEGGIVVYFKQESNRFSSSPTGLIEQGAQVKEGQKLLRIPDLNRMQVNTKVHEAMVSRIKADVRESTGLVEGIEAGYRAAFGLGPVLTQAAVTRAQAYDKLANMPRFRDKEFRYTQFGMRATIKVDAMQNRVLRGHVRAVANVASQADAWASDVKVYQTVVVVEGVEGDGGSRRPSAVPGLKPDMSAEVTIHVDSARNVLTVPLQAVFTEVESGKRMVYVKTPAGPERKEVKLGLFNDTMIEVKEGLEEGDEVVSNPTVLIGGSTAFKTRDAEDSGRGQKGGWQKGGGGGGPKGGAPEGTKKGMPG